MWVLVFYDYFWIKTTFVDRVRQRRHFGLVSTTLHILTFEDKGRLHSYHNKVKIDRCWGNPFQACLSEIAIDRDQPRLSYNRLGLFICWIGHNCTVPSSPPRTPRSGAHWPSGMEQFTPFHWRQFCDACLTNSQSLQRLFAIFSSTII